MFHRFVYRFCAIALSGIILSLIIFVVVFAQYRRSGQTGIDASEIVKMRYEAEKTEVTDVDLGDGSGLPTR